MEPLFSNNIFLLILALAWILLVLISRFIARRIARAFTESWERWVYLALSILPLVEAFKVVFREPHFWGSVFFWFWVAYYVFCLAAFGYLTGREKWFRRQ